MLLVLVLFLVFIFMGMPVAFAFGISGIAYFLQQQMPILLTIPVQEVLSNTQNFLLLAIPLFILAGNLLNESGITERVLKLASVLTGHMRAGLAQSNMVLAASLGGITSSAIGDAAMLSRMLGPGMVKRYSRGFSAGVIGCSALITTMIPPGIGLVLYGSIGDVSIGRLFAAGLMPGLLMTIFLMVAVAVQARRKGYAPERKTRASFKEIGTTFIDSIWAFLFPVILIIGLRAGWFTPSEGGAFACVYAVVVGAVAYREFSWKKLIKSLENTVVDIGMVMLLIALSAIFSHGIIYDRIPQQLAELVLGLSHIPWVVMLIMILFLLLAGTFMDSTVLILMLTSILIPVATSLGMNLVHFGIIMVLTLTLGLLSPPEGAVLYIICTIFECKMWDFVKEGWVFFLSIVLVVLLVLFFPDIALWLPNLIFGKG